MNAYQGKKSSKTDVKKIQEKGGMELFQKGGIPKRGITQKGE